MQYCLVGALLVILVPVFAQGQSCQDDSGCSSGQNCSPLGQCQAAQSCYSDAGCPSGDYCASSGVCMTAKMCSVDMDCGGVLLCYYGHCQNPTTTMAPTPAHCQDDAGCSTGQNCSPFGQCVTAQSCSNDAGCPSGDYCASSGVCMTAKMCSQDMDCGGVLMCYFGHCQNPTTTTAPPQVSCTDDTACSAGQDCSPLGYCQTAQSCSSDSGCSAVQYCASNGLCMTAKLCSGSMDCAGRLVCTSNICKNP